MKRKINRLSDGFHIDYADDDHPDRRPPLEHYHAWYEVVYYVTADVDVFVKDVRYDIHDGDLIFIGEYEIHRVIYKSSSRYTRYVMSFTRSFMSPFLKALQLDYLLDEVSSRGLNRGSIGLSERSDMEAICNTLLRLTSKGSCDDPLTPALVRANILLLLAKVSKALRSGDASEDNRKDRHVREIVNYIDSNYMNHINLNGLASRFFLSKYYISHVFREVTGFSVTEYIQHRRIIEAQKLLRSTDARTTDVCYSCGFTNLNSFCKVFKRICGMSPRRYRQQYRTGERRQKSGV